MKKLKIVMLAFLFIGLGNAVAQTDATTDKKTEEVKSECPFSKTEDGKLICLKTGKECSKEELAKCHKGGKKSCCSSKKGSSDGFNFNKTNNYGGNKSSCQGKEKRSGCSKGAKKKKGCCSKKGAKKGCSGKKAATDTDSNTE
ncbi:MAG: hypothetical protein H8E84_07270 [Flavobacteriales bacterium]|nr:hypothetical protein [Flavobacteriales bacterium]